MAKITRIKAKDSPKEKSESNAPAITRKKVVVEDKKIKKNKKKIAKKIEKDLDSKASERKPFIVIRPLVYLGRYLKDSWKELRQVRWPNRKTAWKMVFAVVVFTALFVVIISLLDIFFGWLFNIILGKG